MTVDFRFRRAKEKMRTIAANPALVRHLRKARGWTQNELAKKVGLTDRTIANIERGQPAYASTIALIAEAFRVAPATLMREPAQSSPGESDDWDAARQVARSLGIPIESVTTNSSLAAVLANSILFTQLTVLIRVLDDARKHLNVWEDETSMESSHNIISLEDFKTYFDRFAHQTLSGIDYAVFSLDVLPAVADVLEHVIRNLHTHSARIRECLVSTPTPNPSRQDVQNRLNRARTISQSLREEIADAIGVLQTKQAGMRQELLEDVARVDAASKQFG